MVPLLAAAEAALSMDFAKNAPLQSITLYLFFAGTVAMGAGALYFFLLRNNVEPVYRSTMVVAGLVCAIACLISRSRMTRYFAMPLSAATSLLTPTPERRGRCSWNSGKS